MGEHRTEIEWVPVSNIIVDPRVNTRPPEKSFIDKAVDDFDVDALGVPDVAPRAKGVYAVIDGQHRVEIVRRALGDDQHLQCTVHYGLSVPEQAALFLKLNNARAISPFPKFTARVNAREPDAVDIVKILDAHHLALTLGGSDGTIQCVTTLEKLYNYGGKARPKELVRTLDILINAWGRRGEAMAGQIVAGLGHVVIRYGDQLDPSAMSSRLAKRGSPSELLGSARSAKGVWEVTVSNAISALIVNEYNKGRRVKPLTPWLDVLRMVEAA